MISKFVFKFPNAATSIAASSIVNGGYNIAIDGGGTNGIPSEIQLRSVAKCSIDASLFVYNNGSFLPPFASLEDSVTNKNTNSSWGCNSGDNDNNFGKIFAGQSKRSGFGDLTNIIEDYTAIFRYSVSTAHNNYCDISLNLKPGKTCAEVGFGDSNYYFSDLSGNRINSGNFTSAPTLPTINSIGVVCAGSTVPIQYPLVNSTALFNTTLNQLEITPSGSADLGCQYGDGSNYMSFFCNADGGIDAVQYKCGL